jgi:lipopolysaccharide exporter
LKLSLSYLLNTDYFKNSLKLVSGTVVGQVLTLAVAPILSRLYGAEDFGVLALFNSWVGVLIILSTLRLEMGLVVASDKVEARNLFRNIYKLIFCFSGAVLLISVAAYLLVETPRWSLFLFLGILFQALFMLLSYDCNRDKAYRNISFSKVIQSLSNAGVAILGGYLAWKHWGLLAANLIGFLAALVYLFRGRAEKIAGIKLFNFQKFKKETEPFKEFPKYNLPASFLDTLSQHLPVFALSHFFSTAITGYYSLAMKVLLLPLALVGNAVGQVFYQKLTEMENTFYKRRLVCFTWGALFLLGIMPFSCLYLWGPDLFAFVFGEPWRESGKIAAALSPMLLVMFMSSPTSTAFIVVKQQKYNFIFGVTGTLYRSAAFYYGWVMGDFYLGIKVWVVCEYIQIFFYNAILWRKM